MKYNWKLKLKYVEEYKAGKYIELPHNFRGDRHNFIHMVRDWVKIFDLYGVDGLKNNYKNTLLSADEKLEYVARILAGESLRTVAFEARVGVGTIYQWTKTYKTEGYDGLKLLKKGRPSKKPVMNKDDKAKKLTKSEKEELILLRKQIEYLKAENAYLKKLRALIVQKQAESSVKAKKQPLSEDSEKKDID